jgi:F-type H+-transporting ATPase subunit delta
LITNAIARRYAKALVQLGAEEGAVEKFNTELAAVNSVLEANPGLSAVFRSPAYVIEAKQEILKEIIGKLGLSATVANFLQLILDRSRLDFLPQIVESYSSFADELSGVIRPTLSSGLPLDKNQIGEIKAALEKSTGKRVVMNVQVDPLLIGGVVTMIGGTVYDGSVKTQINRIEDILQKG